MGKASVASKYTFNFYKSELDSAQVQAAQCFWKSILEIKDKKLSELEDIPEPKDNDKTQSKNKDEPLKGIEGYKRDQKIQDLVSFEIIPASTPDLPKDITVGDALWQAIREDTPDNYVLRFLAARKYDHKKALKMLLTNLKWRQHDELEKLIFEGESKLEASLMYKKVSCHQGCDKEGNPIMWVRSKDHFECDQTLESVTRYSVWLMETLRQAVSKADGKVAVVVDMTGYSKANMDWPYLKAILRIFEADYPESLAYGIIYNGPWYFSGVYKLIKPLLDPVVASKVRFASDKAQLLEHIDEECILKSLGGEPRIEYDYVLPEENENEKMVQYAVAKETSAARDALIKDFVSVTEQWLAAADSKDEEAEATLASKRAECEMELRKVSQELDCFTRSRSVYNRLGFL